MHINLFETLEATLDAVDPDGFAVAPPRAPDGTADVTVVVRDDALAATGRDAVAQNADVSAVAPSNGRFVLRYMDDAIAQLGAALEAGEPVGMGGEDLLGGELRVVGVCDVPAGQTMHIGQLREVAVGHSLAAVLQAAGGDVMRRIVAGHDEILARLGVGPGTATAGSERLDESPASVETMPAPWSVHVPDCGAIVLDTDRSRGESLRVDELLDLLLDAPATATAAGESRDEVVAGDLAVMALLGLCLASPAGQPVVVPEPELLDANRNAGWRLALAWARAWRDGADGAADPDPADPAYRYLVMQSQLHRRQLRAVVDARDAHLLVDHLARLAAWYLQTQPSPRVDRLMRRILGSGLAASGLLRAPLGMVASPRGR